MTTTGPAVREHETVLPVEPISAGRARRFVSAALDGWGLPGLVDAAVLLTSEVVTNALLHTATPTIRLRLRRLDGAVRIEVDDDSPATPRARRPSETAEGGRGIALVGTAAAAWGTDRRRDGKTVWFELPTG